MTIIGKVFRLKIRCHSFCSNNDAFWLLLAQYFLLSRYVTQPTEAAGIYWLLIDFNILLQCLGQVRKDCRLGLNCFGLIESSNRDTFGMSSIQDISGLGFIQNIFGSIFSGYSWVVRIIRIFPGKLKSYSKYFRWQE